MASLAEQRADLMVVDNGLVAGRSHGLVSIRGRADRKGTIATCRCGWRSAPMAAGDLAHQAFERHEDTPQAPAVQSHPSAQPHADGADAGGMSLADLFRQSGPEGRRIGRRVHTPMLWFDWYPSVVKGRPRWGRRPRSEPRARVIDLSITGAMVLVANEVQLRPGTVVRLELDGASGSCSIRRSEPGAAGMSLYSIQFHGLELALRDRINDLVSADRGALDQRWTHAY